MLTTRFTELVGCQAPIQLAPMGANCTPELLAAVAEAGGLGMVAFHLAPANVVAAALDTITAEVAGPVGMNFLIPFVERDAVEVAARRAKLVDFYHGDVDASLVDVVHQGGALAGWQIVTVDDARAAVDAGCDVIVVRGLEGGGRMHGDRSLWPLLAETLDAVDGSGARRPRGGRDRHRSAAGGRDRRRCRRRTARDEVAGDAGVRGASGLQASPGRGAGHRIGAHRLVRRHVARPEEDEPGAAPFTRRSYGVPRGRRR